MNVTSWNLMFRPANYGELSMFTCNAWKTGIYTDPMGFKLGDTYNENTYME